MVFLGAADGLIWREMSRPQAKGGSFAAAREEGAAGARGGPPGVVVYLRAGSGLRLVVEYGSPGVHFLPLPLRPNFLIWGKISRPSQGGSRLGELGGGWEGWGLVGRAASASSYMLSEI